MPPEWGGGQIIGGFRTLGADRQNPQKLWEQFFWGGGTDSAGACRAVGTQNDRHTSK